MINILQQISAAHEDTRARLPAKARWGIILLLSIITLVLFIFRAEWLMHHMIALVPLVYIIAFLAVGLKRALYGVVLFAFFSFALWLRVGPPYDYVLGGDWVVFLGNDPWYHMRLVENLIAHFPSQITFDPYSYYPHGQQVVFAPFFDWILALIILTVSLGGPSAELIEKMGAYYPALLGALTVVPVYFIGKELFSRNMGLIAAGLLAIAPGEFLFRSLLGFTDHHAMETLLSTVTILFFMLAVKRARESRPTFGNIKNREWSALKKPLIYSLLTGFVLGLYLLSWVGGVFFVLIMVVYLVVQYVIDHLRGESTDYLCIISLPLFLLALIMFGPFWRDFVFAHYAMIGLLAAIVAPIALSIVSRLMQRYSLRRLYYPLALGVLAGLAALILRFADPSLFKSVTGMFSHIFGTSAVAQTIMEAQPLFSGFTLSQLTDHRVWSYFTSGLFIAPVSFLLLIYSAFGGNRICRYIYAGLAGLLLLTVVIDQFAAVPYQFYLAQFMAVLAAYAYLERSPFVMMFMVWTGVMLLAMLGQTRFAYYFAVNVALLSAYLLWKIPGWITQLLALAGWRESGPEEDGRSRAEKKRAKKKQEQPAFNRLRPVHISAAVSIVIAFFIAVYPTLFYPTHGGDGRAFDVKASATYYLASHPYGPDDDWNEALVWMRENTPEPFGDPDYYYALYEKPEAGEPYPYPDSAYGVMSWWDYGHWITRMAHRIPVANPHQKGIGRLMPDGSFLPGASPFMLAQDEATASAVMDALDSRYVVIDLLTAYHKYHTMVTWSGHKVSDYYEIWYRDADGTFIWYENPPAGVQAELQLFYPPYYRSMCARLYNFGAEAAVPNNSTYAVAFSEGTTADGYRYKVMTGVANNGEPFPNYEEAAEFIENNPGYEIVGTSPFQSPIPLEPLQEYERIYSSSSIVTQAGGINVSYVEVFEYTGYSK